MGESWSKAERWPHNHGGSGPRTMAEETEKLQHKPGTGLASQLFETMVTNPKFTEFLTLVGYDHIA